MMSANCGMSSGNGSSSGGGGSGGPCGACKFLRRKCLPECIFAPYFDSEQGVSHFAAVHKVFGTSNFTKHLQSLPVQHRLIAVVTMCYEARARVKDPVYGSVANILSLQQQVLNLKVENSNLKAHLEAPGLPSLPSPSPPLQTPLGSPLFGSYHDFSSLFQPTGQTSWTIQQPQTDPFQFGGSSGSPMSPTFSSIEALARELLQGDASSASPSIDVSSFLNPTVDDTDPMD